MIKGYGRGGGGMVNYHLTVFLVCIGIDMFLVCIGIDIAFGAEKG